MAEINLTNNSEYVKKQYESDKNLSIRGQLHAKYRTNKQQTLMEWLFEKYDFSNDCHILELGCGNGYQWENRIEHLPNGCTLILSDLSDGMVNIVWEKYSKHKNMLAQKIDIQNIPFPENCFDAVIANYMLYHVPDIAKGLSEVRRILKPGCKFYSATNGTGGMNSYIRNAYKKVNPQSNDFPEISTFSLQNGKDILSEHFKNVERFDYEDSLAVTNTQDLMDWIKSLIRFSVFDEKALDKLYDYFENIRQKEGVINIPKETGLFISEK